MLSFHIPLAWDNKRAGSNMHQRVLESFIFGRWEEAGHTRGERANSTQRSPRTRVWPRTLLLWVDCASHRTAVWHPDVNSFKETLLSPALTSRFRAKRRSVVATNKRGEMWQNAVHLHSISSSVFAVWRMWRMVFFFLTYLTSISNPMIGLECLLQETSFNLLPWNSTTVGTSYYWWIIIRKIRRIFILYTSKCTKWMQKHGWRTETQ